MNKPMILIGISGKKESGKNTVADLIEQSVKEYDSKLPIHKSAFADSLKDEVCKACNITRNYLEEHKDNFRLIMQGWGTDFKRKLVNDNYWIGQWLDKATKLDDRSILLVTDVRFKNEYDVIKDIGGYVWRVNRPVLKSNDSHISENELDDYKFDETINNNSTLFSLQIVVKDKVNSLLNKLI